MPLLMCDLDDTLVERAPLFRALVERFVAEHGGGPDLAARIVEEDARGYTPRAEFFDALDRAAPPGWPTAAFVTASRESWPDTYRLTPEVAAALADAQGRGWTVAVVTNGPTEMQTRKLVAAGLDRIAAAVCISEEVGANKPDPRIFETAASRAGVPLDGAWMIGDDLGADIAGAAAVGARSVWVKRHVTSPAYDPEVTPDLVAATFPEAVRLVLSAADGASAGAG
jgi:putative hydrolase of the HAD superfamily